MGINNLFVVGTGFMGSGILENAAQKGVNVVAYDAFKEQLEKSQNTLIQKMDRKISKGRMTEADKAAILDKIEYTPDLSRCKDAEIIIEAVSEKSALKISIMKEVEKYAKKDAVIATNTSSISITKIGSALKDPSRFLGMNRTAQNLRRNTNG